MVRRKKLFAAWKLLIICVSGLILPRASCTSPRRTNRNPVPAEIQAIQVNAFIGFEFD